MSTDKLSNLIVGADCRLYNQLEEVKKKKAHKAREDRMVDVQARRKEYSNSLQARTKRS